jgi:hypothetical protein
MERNHDFYLWLRINKGAAPNLFVCVMYVTPVGSKHESKSLFQNLATDIAEVQTLGGIILLGRILMRMLQRYHIPLILVTFVNCYRRLRSLKLRN